MRNFQSRPVLAVSRLEAIAAAAQKRLGAPRGTLGVAFVDDRLMREHHGRYRGQPTTTDVLAFPNELDLLAGISPQALGGEDEPVPYWGDVIVCADQAARQSRSLRQPYEYELALLVLHGALHLLGHDHTRDHGQMARLEEALRPVCWAAGRRA